MTVYTYYQNPDHGWVRVPLAELRDLGFQPSTYSYVDGPWAYLEEDCDAPAWIKARAAAGCPVARETLREVHQNGESHIRDMARYTPDLAVQTMTRLLKAVGAP